MNINVINADGFNSDPSNDDETSNYRRRRLAELSREMESVINATGQWKRNLKLYKNDSVRIRARCDEKVPVFTMSQEPVVGQDNSGGSSVGVVIGLSAADGQGGTGGPGVGIGSQGLPHTRWTKRRVQTVRISPQKTNPTRPASQPLTSSQVPVTETKNADGREMGDGIPTQSSTAGGASEWTFL
ncbi:hypothetical protein Tco_0168202 [Tanacetum coccineum]